MLRTTLKTALRSIRKQKAYSFINIFGLAVGLAGALLMLVYITFELSYDRFHENSGRIQRISTEFKRGDDIRRSLILPGNLPYETELPEVEKSVRLFTYSWKEKALITSGGKSIFVDGFFLADPALFEVFSFPALRGNPASVLRGRNDLVITESAARRFFGAEDPIGKVLSVKNLRTADFKVGAVVRDVPRNSHFRFEIVAPITAGKDLFWENFEPSNSFYVYLLLRRGASAAALQQKLPAFLARHFGSRVPPGLAAVLQPLTSIHLGSHLSDEILPNGNSSTVVLFAVLALVLIAVAAINYVNLATARSLSRAREVGIKKVLGAPRGGLVRQFLGEAVLLAFLALPLAAVIAQLLLPVFNSVLNLELPLVFSGNIRLFAGAILLTAVVGLAAGAYPAAVISGFEPIHVLKGKLYSSPKGRWLRSSLVVLQNAVSVVLMIGALIVFEQMRFVRQKNLGFDKDQVVLLPIRDYQIQEGYETAKTAFLGHPAVLSVSASLGVPSKFRSTHLVWREGLPAGQEEELPVVLVDFDFLRTFGISIGRGRDFSPVFATDEKLAYLVNETAARAFGWADPLGKKIQFSNRNLRNAVYDPGEVVGVVKDFHARSLHEKIQPLILKIEKSRIDTISIRLAPGRIREGLDVLAARWKTLFPGRPFEFSFFDEEVDRLYQEDRRMGRLFAYATAFGILIAGLGLFGLISFILVQRTKEIGIRKVLGASLGGLVTKWSSEFGRLVLAANAIAWPVAFFIMNKWLGGFAYRIRPGIGVFLLAGALSLLIALTTIAGRAVRAAAADPVKSLRYE